VVSYPSKISLGEPSVNSVANVLSKIDTMKGFVGQSIQRCKRKIKEELTWAK
jgi:hypothetical protein